jgi:exodeoxyribonuclease VII large subunit
LYIKDLDPTYTIGDLAAKLAAIRDTLQKEGIYNKNKQLKLPMDFTRVAVLSPNAAAGLGDFKREASLLESYKLCSFYYYTAQFQGLEAAEELANVLNEIFVAHNEIDFDVIVIIRGGGSAIDLAWLNDYRIAKIICEGQVVVYSGIGHERDNTIIDEVAGCRFDTPSKVIAHIFSTIVHNAKEALVHATEIKNLGDTIYTNHYNAVMGELNKAFKIAELSVLQISQNVEQKYSEILANSQNTLTLTATLINQYYVRIYEHNTLNLQYTTVKLTEYFTNINKFLPNLCLITFQELQVLWNNVIAMLHGNHSFSNEAVTTLSTDIKERSTIQYYQTGQMIEELITNIISLGPRATLERGYTIVRDPLNKTLSSRVAANSCKKLQIEFYDGIIQVINNYNG